MFDLESVKRSQDYNKDFQEKLRLEDEEIKKKRQFRAVPMLDYEKNKLEVMPSDKPLTQAAKPNFISDLLPKKQT